MAYTIAEKAISFWHPDYNPDRAQKLISSSMSRHLSTRNISFKSMHAFLSNLANIHSILHEEDYELLIRTEQNRQTNAGKRIYLLLCRK